MRDSIKTVFASRIQPRLICFETYIFTGRKVDGFLYARYLFHNQYHLLCNFDNCSVEQNGPDKASPAHKNRVK